MPFSEFEDYNYAVLEHEYDPLKILAKSEKQRQ